MSEFAVHFLFRILLQPNEEKVTKETILTKLNTHFKFTEESDEYIIQQFLFDLCDKHREGKMDYETFLSFMKCIEIYNTSVSLSREVSIMKSIFAAIDTDHSETLSKREIQSAMRKYSNYREKNEVMDITINTISDRLTRMNDNEELSMVQFLELLVKPNEFEEYHRQLYGGLFDRADTDHSGTINAKELRVLLKEIYPLGIEKKKAEELIINTFDPLKTQKHTITKNQFVKFITFALCEKGSADYLSKYKLYTTLCKMVDSNKNGLLESNEIEDILRGFGKKETKINVWFNQHGGRGKTYHIDEFVKILISKK